MFADLSARSYIDRRRRWKSPVAVCADESAVVRQIGERKRGRQLSAPTQSDVVKPRTGALGEGQTAVNMPSNKGLRPPAALHNPCIPVFIPLRDS
jgi:hypothetical protein